MTTNFVKWTSLFVLTYAICEALFIGFAGLALNLPLRMLLLPYVMLLYAAFATGPLIYWARQSYDRPKSFALRFASAVSLGSLLFMLALAFDVVRVGLLPSKVVLSYFAPYILPGCAIAWIMVYRSARKRSGTNSHHNDSDRAQE